jgi:hypothetical protein
MYLTHWGDNRLYYGCTGVSSSGVYRGDLPFISILLPVPHSIIATHKLTDLVVRA